jgi:glycerophosphoryl diester phosphodiesterase
MSFRPLLLGHRGARAVRGLRENTIESFDRALADGCDGFEFDVHRTADGEAVIWHDAESDGKLIEEASADQLPQLARLEDVLSRYRDSAFLDIELKVAGLEKITSSLLRSYRVEKGFVLSSFLPDVLTALHSENANLRLD